MENGHSNGSAQLQARLNDPHIAAVLTRLLDRIDSLEETVNALTTAVHQAPGMVSMVTDMADGAMRSAHAAGIDVEARLKAGLIMADKLTAPETMAKFDQLLTLADQAPGMVSMVTDMADATVRRAAANGVDIEERLKTALAIADKLTAPEMANRLDQLLALADQAPGMVSMVTDMADAAMRQAMINGIDVEERARIGLDIVQKATAPHTLRSLDNLFETLLTAEQGVLSPEAVEMVGMAAQSLVTARQQPVKRMGLFDLLGALRDPQLQAALGFLINVGREFGKEVK